MRGLSNSLLLLGLSSLAAAVFKDEVGDVDFHHALFGVPQPETTFFHRPRKDDKASLLYTLGDVGVFGAVNPSNGAVVWRHQISSNTTDGGGHLRAPEDEDWVAAAYGHSVHAWSAMTGRNVWHAEFAGQVKDLEIMEMTETSRKDVLTLFQEDGVTVLRRLHGTLGTIVWEFREHNKDIPLQVSTNIANIYVVSLHGSPSSYNLKITSLDTATGARVNDWAVGTKGDVHGPKDVMFVGANSAAPILAWADSSLSKLNIHVLGSKGKQEFPLASDTIDVAVHAPHKIQSQPHFLVHMKSAAGNRAEVHHINLKNGQISKAYELAHLKAQCAFSTSSEGANVYFTRTCEDEVTITSSESPAILSRWLPKKAHDLKPVHAVSEVIRKPGGEEFAVRSAAVTSDEDWVMVRNGEKDWSRPEGLSGAVAAVWVDIPEAEDLAKVLEQEAHTNPVSAYIHRVNRHINDLRRFPAWLQSIPSRLKDSILGGGAGPKETGLRRDSFGFNKIIVLVTRRGRVYGLDTGNSGKILWATQVFPQATDHALDVKGIVAQDGSQVIVTVSGSRGEAVQVDALTGELLSAVPPQGSVSVSSTAIVEGPVGPYLLQLSPDGKPIGPLSAATAPKNTIVIRSGDDMLKGFKLVADEDKVTQQEIWQLQVMPTQRIVQVATRAPHDPVASIGRVLGDRRVSYKYLNPNTVVVAIFDDAVSALSVQVVDTVSGQILTSQRFDGVDGGKDISCAIAENFHVCSFFGQHKLNDGTNRLVKGYQIVSTDLYESPTPNDRGPLGDAANFSSLEPVDTPSGPPLPWAVSQGWVISQPIRTLTVTQTRQGIANRQILGFMPESHGIVGLPRVVIDPRRPVGRDPTPAEMEAEGLAKYAAALEIDPRTIISHERDVVGVEGIVATPAIVESTSLVVAYGIDIFGTRVAPSGVFDILGKGFNKTTLILTVVSLFGGVMFLAPMVRRKQINRRWEVPT
ncbi:ER membrane protein complex subunit-like protein [Hapsidospora chrysogenum ATCC 11550]|uniref:ER membrane protein complex subunit 1 n=1 Tax=Hapsidospora chrysogenum (strain ATCC 11550 / CBS 779.69 / DSM 880 / IAM 14645 / JCM 23072 / IMI 49137) TaxID=857340 RepID=A0A086SYG1_HAPC1|nr:ER membrane protein complex subunit-like protein [Hapsidospora chrysogenum ATCC 11550]